MACPLSQPRPVTLQMRNLAILFIIAIVALSAACSRHAATEAALDRADSLMSEHPDSALAILTAIDGTPLPQGSGLQARYALLLTQAKTKNHIIETNDSLISIANDYYYKEGDEFLLMKARFYLGNILYHQKNYPNCMLNMFMAYEYAKEIDDCFWIGMTARGLGDAYKETFNSKEEVAYYHIAADAFASYGKQAFIDYSLLYLAIAYCDAGEYESGIVYALEARDSALTHGDEPLLIEALRAGGMNGLGAKNYKIAISSFETLCKNHTSTREDSLYLGLLYLRTGAVHKATNILNKIKINEDGVGDWFRYELYKELDSIPQALTALENLENYENSTFNSRINQGLTGVCVDYYDTQKRAKEEDIKRSHVINWAMLFLLICLITISLAYILRYKKKKQSELDTATIIAENLRDILSRKEEEYRQVNTAFTSAKETIDSLLDVRYEEFDMLCQEMYSSSNRSSIQKQIASKLNMMVDSFSSDIKKIKELQKFADLHHDNIVSELKKDLPSIKDIDHNLFLYVVLGFSTQAIALFLKAGKIDSIYERKRRLKDKIKQLDATKAQKYQAYL